MELSAFLKDRWHGDSRLGELEELEVLIGKRGTRHDFEKEAAVTLTKSGVWLCAWCAWPVWNQKKKKKITGRSRKQMAKRNPNECCYHQEWHIREVANLGVVGPDFQRV